MPAETTTAVALGGAKLSPDAPEPNRAMQDPAMADTRKIPERMMAEALQLRRQGSLEQAEAPPGANTQTATADPQADFRIAFEHHQAGRLAEAEAIYREILAGNAKHVDCLHLLGVVWLQFGRTDDAIALLQQALDLNPDSAEAHNNLGVALRSRGETEQAVPHWEKAVALKPDY